MWGGKDSNLRRHLPSDLQSDAFDRFATSPQYFMSWRRDLNPQPADYKSAALPIELRQQTLIFELRNLINNNIDAIEK